MEVNKNAIFPSVRPGHCQHLPPFIFMWCKENFTDFRLTIFTEMLARSGQEPLQSMPVGRPAPASTNIGWLDTRHNKHWPGRNRKQRSCLMSSARGVTQTVLLKFFKCDVALCVDGSCFEDCHTKHHFFYFVLRANCWSLHQNVSKTWYLQLFRNLYSPVGNKDITAF